MTIILIAQLNGEEQWGRIKDEIIRQTGIMYRDCNKTVNNGLVYNKLFNAEEKTFLQSAVESLEDKTSEETITLFFIEVYKDIDAKHMYLSAKAYED